MGSKLILSSKHHLHNDWQVIVSAVIGMKKCVNKHKKNKVHCIKVKPTDSILFDRVAPPPYHTAMADVRNIILP